MICHDGGFRYSGDFMSMESEIIEPAGFLSPDDVERLRNRGFVTGSSASGAIQVTDAGRRLAYSESGGQ